jgi:excisionase family DNA binding protein
MTHKNSFDALNKGGLPSLPQGPEFTFKPETWLTTPEAAAFLKCGVRTVCNFIARGQLKASFIGRQWLLSQRNIEAFIKAQEEDIAQSE